MASKRNERRKMCAGKVAHDSKPGAYAALNKIPAPERGKMHVYKCPHCKKRTRRREFIEG